LACLYKSKQINKEKEEMNKLLKLLMVSFAAVMVFGLIGCKKNSGSGNAQESGKIEIAFITKSMQDLFFIDAKVAAEERAKELDINLTYMAPAGGFNDSAGQVRLVEDTIVKGVDAIIIDVCDNVSLNPSLVKAKQAGIPIVLFNDVVDFDDLKAQGGSVDCYVGLNSYEAARLVAEYCIKTSKPGKVAILEGLAGTTGSIDRTNGFADVLPSDYRVVASLTSNWTRDGGFDVTQNILTANPDIGILYATNSMSAMGALQVIELMGLTGKIDVYDFDCEPDDIEAIKAGALKATLRYPTKEWSKLAVDTTMKILNGEKVPAELYTEVMVVSRDNLDTIKN
jgi:ABC-type sugar transport system substrate-binding protein